MADYAQLLDAPEAQASEISAPDDLPVPLDEPVGRHRHVVVVDDEPTLRRIIVRNLVTRGLAVREAETADEAVHLVLAERPDLLLLDVNLPDRSGWDVLRDLHGRGIDVPTIVISAVRCSPNRIAEFHPLAYLPKPFPLEALLTLVVGPADRGGRSEHSAWDPLD